MPSVWGLCPVVSVALPEPGPGAAMCSECPGAGTFHGAAAHGPLPHRRFLLELERRMEENIVISDVCDIVYHYAANHFSVYITYVSNQTYQERTYKQLL